MDILVVIHADDKFTYSHQSEIRHYYMLGPILVELVQLGHKVMVYNGLPEPPMAADLAIMHVDLTVVPSEYVSLGARYPRCLNLSATDISKRVVSGALIDPASGWDGPVIVKSNLNWRGEREVRLSSREAASPTRRTATRYAIHDSLRDVPGEDVDDPDLVIVRFLPERDGDYYVCRFWTFAGDQERCTRVFAREPIVKASNLLGFEFCDVPDELRQRRRELGFDFGKFDFVIHDGRAVLLDANKTPGVPPVTRTMSWPLDFANGLLGCLD